MINSEYWEQIEDASAEFNGDHEKMVSSLSKYGITETDISHWYYFNLK